jgi:hypothetical protein
MEYNQKRTPMPGTSVGTVRAKIATDSHSGPVIADEILDWDVPMIDVQAPSDTMRVRVRDADPEPMLSI